MRPRDRGNIVNVGSALAFIGIPLQSPYCAAKFACRGFFESTRAELLHEGSHVRLSMVHLPAVNTPQFDWCQTSMDRHPQPVPPIYQPEIPAKFIVQAALDGRRSKVIGSWNKLLVAAGQIAPGLGNHYAALGAWDTQLADLPIGRDRPDNLNHPADDEEDAGAHGIFDGKAGGFFDPSFLKTLPKRVAPSWRPRSPMPVIGLDDRAHVDEGQGLSSGRERPRFLWPFVPGGASRLLIAPGAVLRLFGGADEGRAPRRVMRVLGARHLVQAGAEYRLGGRAREIGTGVDLLHGATSVISAS